MTDDEMFDKLQSAVQKLLYITQCGEYLTFVQMHIVQEIIKKINQLSSDEKRYKLTIEGLEGLIDEHENIEKTGAYRKSRVVRFH